jgi:hypothetical protein
VLRLRAVLRLVLVMFLTMTALGGGQASAQFLNDEEGVYVSEVTDLEITFTDDWELGDATVFDGPPEEESVQILSEYGALSLAFVVTEDAEASRDQVISGYETNVDQIDVVDEGYEDGVAWILADAEQSNGLSVFLYLEVREDVLDDFQFVTMIVADKDVFFDQYELVQDTVEVDGLALFDRVDAGDLEDLLDGGTVPTGRDDADNATPDVDEDGNESETGNRRGSIDDTGSEDTYQFDGADLEVTVSGDVVINDVQVQEGSYEQILLVGSGAIGAVSLIDNTVDADITLDGFMSGFVSEMENAEEIDRGEEDGVAWTIYEATVNGSDMYVYAIVDGSRFDDVHHLELIAAPVQIFEDQFVEFQESVDVGGDPMFADIDVTDLMDIIEGA